jgi:hypothetical protein
MLKLLLVTLGIWSVLSLLLVGTLGFFIHLREQRASATGGSFGAKFPRMDDRVARINRAHAVATRGAGKPPIKFLRFPRNPLCLPTVDTLELARTKRATAGPCRGIRRRG